MPEIKKSIMDIFEENELRISALYKMYAQKLPAHQTFWERLSKEEISHAQDIHQKKALYEEIKENNFTRGVVGYVRDFVEESIRLAENKNFSHLDAINTALRVEQSILEKKCFEIFIPTNFTLKEVLKKLNRETDRHIKLLQKELKKQKVS